MNEVYDQASNSSGDVSEVRIYGRHKINETRLMRVAYLYVEYSPEDIFTTVVALRKKCEKRSKLQTQLKHEGGLFLSTSLVTISTRVTFITYSSWSCCLLKQESLSR